MASFAAEKGHKPAGHAASAGHGRPTNKRKWSRDGSPSDEASRRPKKAHRNHGCAPGPEDVIKSIELPDTAMLAESKKLESMHSVDFIQDDFLQEGRGYINFYRKGNDDYLDRCFAELLEAEETEEDRLAVRFKVYLGKGRWVILGGTMHAEINHGRFAEEEVFPKTLVLY